MDEKDISEIIYSLYEDKFSFNPVSPQIYQTSNFYFSSFDELKKALEHKEKTHIYTRGKNPTTEVLEQKIAALEKGERALLFSSGVAAISAVVMGLLKSNDHIVCVKECYNWTYKLFSNYLKKFNIDVTFIDGCEIEEWKNAIKDNTKIFFLESPTSFSFLLQDIKAVASLAKKHNITTIIDNSWATPCFQTPIEYGVDFVVHSCSKYISGHSDVIGGILVGTEDNISHIFQTEFITKGATPSPFNAWLLLRGLRTLPIRMEQHMRTTEKVIDFLSRSSKVEKIYYPFHTDHPQYKLAKKQMKGTSGLFSFKLRTKNLEDIIHFTDALKYFKKAVSWGGYESLVIPAAATDTQASENISVIRLHIGLENPGLLIEDLSQALEIIK